MRAGLLTKKQGMVHYYLDDGTQVPVTVLQVDSVTVVGHRTVARDGYTAVQVGAGHKTPKRTQRAQRISYEKAGMDPKAKVVEFRTHADAMPEIGAALLPSHFAQGAPVDVSAQSIGKGFAGSMKRHNFHGLRASHGVSVSHRAHGSTGQRQDPGKVFKGKKMAGHMGARQVTVQNLSVFQIDDDRGLLLIRGAVPGPKGGWVTVRDSIRKHLGT